jgi:hypothetical protein
VLVVACGNSHSGGDDTQNPPGAFDACGGKIVNGDGSIDPTEYKHQAVTWDRTTIDCRLGPKYDTYHPGDADATRATAAEMPLIAHSGMLCPMYFNHDTPGPANYGSTSGQVAYSPDAATDPGLDRVQTTGWEQTGQCWMPLVNGQIKSAHPDQGMKEWLGAALSPGVPIAKGRTEYAETGDGLVIFSNGLVGSTGTQTSGSTHPTLQLPPNKVPMAVAVSNYNEFGAIAVWDTDSMRGQLAILVMRSPAPPAHSVNAYAAPNEGGFDQIQLLGYVDLPDMATPTAIAFAGNNQGHQGPWVQCSNCDHAYQGVGSIFMDLTYDGMLANSANWVWTSDPTTGPGFFATAGGAIVASQWENKVTFVDFTPLFQFVRTVYVDPIANHADQALYTQAITSSPWPFDFTTNPEMMPKVVTTIAVETPRVVRYGVAPTPNAKGLQSKPLAWIGSLDGTIAAYDISSLDGKPSDAATPIAEVGSVMVDPNPTSLHLTNNNDQLFLSSRGNRSVQWIAASETSIDVLETFRDARVDDPVSTDHNQRMPVISIGDFTSGQVFGFERDDSTCAATGTVMNARTCSYKYEGSMSYPGAVYLIDTANVN